MKYRCTDCGQEYDVKPEFCDCGNNLFEEISGGKSEEKFEDLKNIYPNSEFKPDFPRKRNVDIPSVLIFVLCIVLSILSWIFIGRDTNNLAQNTTDETVQSNLKDIPSIDKLWKEKVPSVLTVTPQPVPESVAMKVVEKKPEKKVAEKPKNTVQNVLKPKQNIQAKPAQQQPKSTMTEQEKQAIIQKLSTKKTPSQKTEPQKVEQKKNETQQTVLQPKQEQIKTEVKQPEVKVPDAAQLKKELDAYKVALRNKLGKAINFGAVIGDGNCAVTFKIDRTGNLLERKFSVQSKNNSLNDAVYAAILGNPTFKEPPEGYKGETLTLTVTMYGGNFEVKLK